MKRLRNIAYTARTRGNCIKPHRTFHLLLILTFLSDNVTLDPSSRNIIGELRLVLEENRAKLRALYPEYYTLCTIYK